MKVVILAGGLGTRLSEETSVRPKPMVEVGGKPVLWHIMKIYAAHGITEFVICLGYRGEYIKEYFANYALQRSDVTFDLAKNKMSFHNNTTEPWTVSCIDTGEASMTGGRLKRVAHLLDETFCFTYGDGVANIDLNAALKFHKNHGKSATLTAVQPAGRFGAFRLDKDSDQVNGFHEKPKGDGAWINGGFFILEPKVIDYIDEDTSVWEGQPLERLSSEGQLKAWRHHGFWQSMDTLRDKQVLNDLWESGDAPWKIW